MRRFRHFVGPAAMAGVAALWGASSLLASVQRGTVAMTNTVTTNTATIAAVDTANSVLVWLGQNGTSASDNPDHAWCGLELTNATTVTATRTTGGNTVTVSFEVYEFLPGVIKRVQRGATGPLTTTPTTATITAVNPSKTFLLSLGRRQGGFTYRVDYSEASFALTNETTITITCVNAAATAGVWVYWQVVELF